MTGKLPLDNLAVPWAVQPDLLDLLARAIAGATTVEEIHAELPQAAPTSSAPAGGGVAVIPLRGLITPRPSLLSILFGGGGGLQSFRADLRGAVSSDEVGSILIDIDSPGGSTDLVTEAAADIREARKTKPVVAIANTTAASAAYWLGSQADEFVITPSGMAGSIGVFAVHQDWSGFNESFGVQPTYISAGKYKVEGNPDEPLSDDARGSIQEMVDDLYGLFVADVAKGRSATARAVRNGYGEGRVVTAQRAVELGMADRVDTFERTLSQLASGPRRRQRARAELERPEPAAEKPQSHDNPPPNDAQSEEETARIAALVTARPQSHILQEGSPA